MGRFSITDIRRINKIQNLVALTCRRQFPDIRRSRREASLTTVAPRREIDRRNNSAGLNGVNSPLSCPTMIQRPPGARERRVAWNCGVSTLSISTSTPLPLSSRNSGAKSEPRASATTSCAPAARSAPTFDGEVVCATTKAPASRASWGSWMPNPPPAPVTSTFSPGCTRPIAPIARNSVPSTQAAIAAASKDAPPPEFAPDSRLPRGYIQRSRRSTPCRRERPPRRREVRGRIDNSDNSRKYAISASTRLCRPPGILASPDRRSRFRRRFHGPARSAFRRRPSECRRV